LLVLNFHNPEVVGSCPLSLQFLRKQLHSYVAAFFIAANGIVFQLTPLLKPLKIKKIYFSTSFTR